MKWSIELAEELVREIAGPESLRILRILFDKENLSEFELADNLKVNINQARHSLYKLQKYNLIASTRKKDKEKGWYIYYWTFNHKNARDLYLELKKKRLEKLKKEVEREKSGEYLTCPEGCVTLSTGDAMESGFRCPTCEEILIYKNDVSNIIEKEHEIAKLDAEVAEGVELPEEPKPKEKKPAKVKKEGKKTLQKKEKPLPKKKKPLTHKKLSKKKIKRKKK